jgi:CRP-like cAMP-binding protein
LSGNDATALITFTGMYQRILQNVSRFIQLTEEEQQFFTSLLQAKKLRKRQYLLQEGDICRNEYFVNSGCLRTYFTDDKGVEHVVQFAPEDWWVGDMYSFITQTPARYAIDALEDTEVLFFDKPTEEKLYQNVPKFERFFRLLLQNAFVAQQNRILSAMSDTAEERYKNFIEKYPHLEQRLPQHQIASYLGITPESLSRIRRQRAEVRGRK